MLIVFVFGETMVRLWGPKYDKIKENLPPRKRKGSNISIREKSEDFHHNLIPNTKAIMYRGEENLPPIVFEINNLGIRGQGVKKKSLDWERILILGDSFIENRLNNFEETVSKLFEKKISNKKIDVIQHGVSSWSPLTELNWYLKVGRTLKPDIVVLFLVINDFYFADTYSQSDAAYEKECIKDESGYPIRFSLKKASKKTSVENKPKSFIERLGDKSKFFKWAYLTIEPLIERKLTQRQLKTLMRIRTTEFDRIAEKLFENTREHKIKKDIIRLTRSENLWDEKTKKVVDEALANVNKLQDVINKDGGKLVVTFIPIGWNFKDETIEGRIGYQFKKDLEIPMGGIEQKVKDFCGENNIQYINLYSAIKRYKEINSHKLYFQQDGHWNSMGNKVVADILYENLFKK